MLIAFLICLGLGGLAVSAALLVAVGRCLTGYLSADDCILDPEDFVDDR